MNLVCKLFGHKRREFVTSEVDFRGIIWGRWVWLRQCSRCGEKLKIEK